MMVYFLLRTKGLEWHQITERKGPERPELYWTLDAGTL